MQHVFLAWRNLFRNGRRTLVTLSAIGLSCAALILIGGYFAMIFAGTELQVVATEGHLQIYRPGYLRKGAADPSSFAIENYESVMSDLASDPFLRDRTILVTARLHFQGLVSRYDNGTTLPFVGFGVIPEDEGRLSRYNPYFATSAYDLAVNRSLFDDTPELSEDDPHSVSLGVGLARSLGLPVPILPSTRLRRDSAERGERQEEERTPMEEEDATAPDFRFLESLVDQQDEGDRARRPSVELLVLPPGGGVPNVDSFFVRKTQDRAQEEIDNRLVKLHLHEASSLVFPGAPPRATSIVILLHDSDDARRAVAHLNERFERRGQGLEARIWSDIRPTAARIIDMFRILLVFVACIVVVMVLFMIYSTMSMGIMERMSELGTLRAIGMSRAGLTSGLVLEGTFLGVGGAIFGVALAFATAAVVNAVTYTYVPPAVSYHVALELMVFNRPDIVLGAFGLTVASAVVSSLGPALQAARLPIIDAIRHV